MTTSRRSQRRDVVRNRAHLLEVADKLIAENGVDLSFNAVARQAGVGVGTVYRHFVDREEIISALLDQRIDVVVNVLQRCLLMADPVAGLRTAVLEVCAMQASDRGMWELLANRGKIHRDSVQQRLLPLGQDLVARAQATGRMRPDLNDTDLPVMFWMGGVLATYAGHVAPDLWRRYIEVMLDGFTASADSSDRAPLSVAPLTTEQSSQMMESRMPGSSPPLPM